MKILHTADWHLDAPLQGHGDALRNALAGVPGQILELVQSQNCDMVLLSGDLFDGAYTPHTYRNLYNTLAQMAVPVFITPGNHDFCNVESPYIRELWPENVHIFKNNAIESVAVPALNARVYGSAFVDKDCPALLQSFRADCAEKYAIGIFHGDPTQTDSPYNPITKAQVENSNLDYLALGHIHKADAFRAGKTLCAWPGCPMGRGYDEEGEKGIYIVTLDEIASVEFYPLQTPRFYDLQTTPEKLHEILPPVGNENYYRITLTGEWETPDLPALQKKYSHFPNLIFRDKTVCPVDIWGTSGEDSFEGLYFSLLRQAMESAPEAEKDEILLAAEISRRLLEGQEVVLP